MSENNNFKFFVKHSKIDKYLNKLDNQVVRKDEPLPKGSPAIWIINGGKGSGKSTLILNVLKSKHAYKGFFDNIFLVSPTAGRDPKFDKLVYELEEDGKYFNHCDDDVVADIVSKLVDFKMNWDEKEEGRKPHSLVIFDDCLASLPKSTEKSMFNELITTSRHINTSVWILTQKYNKVNPLIRAQMDVLSFFRTNSKQEYLTLEESLNVDKNFKNIYEFATAEPNSFLHITFFNNKPTFYKKFSKIIL
jgi:hypothetical protein